MDNKKIAFSFKKTLKKVPDKPVTSSVQLINCIEQNQIITVETTPKEAPLIIPLKENTNSSSIVATLKKRKRKTEDTQSSKTEEASVSNETIEQRAARELLEESQQIESNPDISTLAIVSPDELPLDGATESTLEDYELIPVEGFGAAMLRGMGFEPPPVDASKNPIVGQGPQPRPPGLGLGADKAIKPKPLLIQPEAHEKLQKKIGAYVRILGGSNKDLYGEITGFDERGARVFVKMCLGGKLESFNEYLIQPVAKKEFYEYGKCINTAKYNKYKKMENENGTNHH